MGSIGTWVSRRSTARLRSPRMSSPPASVRSAWAASSIGSSAPTLMNVTPARSTTILTGRAATISWRRSQNWSTVDKSISPAVRTVTVSPTVSTSMVSRSATPGPPSPVHVSTSSASLPDLGSDSGGAVEFEPDPFTSRVIFATPALRDRGHQPDPAPVRADVRQFAQEWPRSRVVDHADLYLIIDPGHLEPKTSLVADMFHRVGDQFAGQQRRRSPALVIGPLPHGEGFVQQAPRGTRRLARRWEIDAGVVVATFSASPPWTWFVHARPPRWGETVAPRLLMCTLNREPAHVASAKNAPTGPQRLGVPSSGCSSRRRGAAPGLSTVARRHPRKTPVAPDSQLYLPTSTLQNGGRLPAHCRSVQ